MRHAVVPDAVPGRLFLLTQDGALSVFQIPPLAILLHFLLFYRYAIESFETFAFQ